MRESLANMNVYVQYMISLVYEVYVVKQSSKLQVASFSLVDSFRFSKIRYGTVPETRKLQRAC
jgi:hypothetical protein